VLPSPVLAAGAEEQAVMQATHITMASIIATNFFMVNLLHFLFWIYTLFPGERLASAFRFPSSATVHAGRTPRSAEKLYKKPVQPDTAAPVSVYN
jgi:hypothetical protein